MNTEETRLKSFAELWEEVEQDDTYWVEHAKTDFGFGLRALLDKRQMLKKDFALAIGKSQAYVSKVCRGDVNFTIESMVKLTRALRGQLHLHVTPIEERHQMFHLDGGSEPIRVDTERARSVRAPSCGAGFQFRNWLYDLEEHPVLSLASANDDQVYGSYCTPHAAAA